MSTYVVVKNTQQPADGQGRVYNVITCVLKGSERDENNPLGIARRWVLSTEPAAALQPGQELSVTITPIIP